MQSTNDEFQNFIHTLVLEKLGSQKLDPEVIEFIKTDLAKLCNTTVMTRIMSQLNEEQLLEVEELLEYDDNSGLQQYLAHIMPDLEQITAQELIEFRKSYLSL